MPRQLAIQRIASCGVILLSMLASAQAELIPPVNLHKDDVFHIIMVTTATTTATSGDIADYNTFVNVNAAANGLDTYHGMPVQWFAVGSTPSIHARDNADVTAPVYRLDGALVATNENDLWNGGINVPVNIAADGTTLNALTWTGTHANNGQGIASRQLGGVLSPFAGNTTETNVSWTTWGAVWAPTTQYYLYAMSQPITVVPEPATLVLAGCAALAFAGFTYRRK